eukprot:gene8503-4863_t
MRMSRGIRGGSSGGSMEKKERKKNNQTPARANIIAFPGFLASGATVRQAAAPAASTTGFLPDQLAFMERMACERHEPAGVSPPMNAGYAATSAAPAPAPAAAAPDCRPARQRPPTAGLSADQVAFMERMARERHERSGGQAKPHQAAAPAYTAGLLPGQQSERPNCMRMYVGGAAPGERTSVFDFAILNVWSVEELKNCRILRVVSGDLDATSD